MYCTHFHLKFQGHNLHSPPFSITSATKLIFSLFIQPLMVAQLNKISSLFVPINLFLIGQFEHCGFLIIEIALGVTKYRLIHVNSKHSILGLHKFMMLESPRRARWILRTISPSSFKLDMVVKEQNVTRTA